MNGQIFISYRRNDSRAYAGRIHDRLTSHFSKEQIFMDVDNIQPGMDFVNAIETAIGKCDVLIAVIGGEWIKATDKNGVRLLDNPEDYVRLEIATALKRNIRVIPVLLDDALMPSSNELPDDLKPLTRRQSLTINHHSFSVDVERLLTVLSNDIAKPEPQKPLWKDEQGKREKYLLALAQCLTVMYPKGTKLFEDEEVQFPRPGAGTQFFWGFIAFLVTCVAARDIWVDDAKEILPYHWWFFFIGGLVTLYKWVGINSLAAFNLKKDALVYDGVDRPLKNLAEIKRIESADKKTTTWKVVFRNYAGKHEAEEKLFKVDSALNKEVVFVFELIKEFYSLGYTIPGKEPQIVLK